MRLQLEAQPVNLILMAQPITARLYQHCDMVMIPLFAQLTSETTSPSAYSGRSTPGTTGEALNTASKTNICYMYHLIHLQCLMHHEPGKGYKEHRSQ
jgi:hypothetical protein